ncbi:MAG TPA: class I SAM-dependent methyltransferase [Solirubrobacterales bacterium]|jgi:SAM-dependent methyltransferase|nr:class I SAM-dependent methyltransferase [Solirubrobacterales bacterium]
MTPQDDYTFGDSDLAARRLELVGSTFEETTRRFLAAAAPGEPAFAVDLGCGPGHTTVLVRETLRPARTLAIDFSPAYVAATAARIGDDDSVEAIEADVLDLPERVAGAAVIFVRLLLTHLRDPLAAIELWRERLAPGGVLLLEEVESVATAEPALVHYLDLQREMLAANGNRLEIGPQLDAGLRDHPALHRNEVATFQPGAGIAARMFGMNFGTWRDRPEVSAAHDREELDHVAAGLGRVATAPEDSAPIIWQMRQIVLGH